MAEIKKIYFLKDYFNKLKTGKEIETNIRNGPLLEEIFCLIISIVFVLFLFISVMYFSF